MKGVLIMPSPHPDKNILILQKANSVFEEFFNNGNLKTICDSIEMEKIGTYTLTSEKNF